MTYTFTQPFNDNARVRFHTGDTTEATAFLSDELISALITEYGTWQKATIQALQYIITQLNDPKFTADWLDVDPAEAVKAYERLLIRKRQELGITTITARAVHTYRADSHQTEAPDYDNDLLSEDEE